MARPGVNIALSNGGLNLQAPSEFGTTAVMVAAPVAPAAGYGVAFLVKTKAQAQTALGQVGNEALLAAVVNGFFGEAAEGTKLYILCMAPATTLATLADPVNAEKALTLAAGQVRLFGLIKYPPEAYEPVITDGFDVDVHNAVIATQTLVTSWFARNKKPFRFFVEGFAFSGAADAKDYSLERPNPDRNGFIVTAAIDGSTAMATMIALGRAAAIESQRNIGRTKDGSLNIPETAIVTIGATKVEDMTAADMDTLYEKRYITIERNQIASGYIFTDDNSLTYITDDYNNLRYGRVIDNATRIAFETYYRELKDDVEVDEGGRLSSVVEKALENAIEGAIDAGMRSQLSKKPDGSADVECYVNPDPVAFAALYEQNDISDPNFNILATGGVYLFVRMRPKGCIKSLNVFLGYTE